MKTGQGIIRRIFGAYYDVLPLPDLDPPLRGRLRGRLRLERGGRGGYQDAPRQRHLLMVGDRVNFRYEKDTDVVIEGFEDRRNAVQRAMRHEVHALGANLDRALPVISLSQPGPRWGFLDRFLTSCESGGVPAGIVFSKADLVEPENEADYERMVDLYQKLGYETYMLDLVTQEPAAEVERLREFVAEGATLFCGQSGTGKSTLLNLLLGEDQQKTGSISESTGKGRHTTTNSSLFVHPDGNSMFIDTPGVKEWGVQHLDRTALLESLPEIAQRATQCRFHDCLHTPGSQGCTVQELLQKSVDRYQDYYQNIESIEENPDVAVPAFEAEYIHPERLRSLNAMLDSLDDARKLRTGDYIKATGRVRTGKIKPG